MSSQWVIRPCDFKSVRGVKVAKKVIPKPEMLLARHFIEESETWNGPGKSLLSSKAPGF